jgi:hypothetical protein
MNLRYGGDKEMMHPYMAEKLIQFEQIRVERAAREYWKVHASQEQQVRAPN